MSILQYASPQYEYDYNDKQILDNYRKDAEAYNKAIEEWNAGPRTTEFTAPPPSFDGDIEAFSQEAADRAQAVGASQTTAQAVMTDPTQTYRTKAGDVNLGGMSGLSSESIAGLAGLAGFADGGIVQNFQEGGMAMESPFADPISRSNQSLDFDNSNLQNISSNMVYTQAMGEEGSAMPPQPMIAARPAYEEVQQSLPQPMPAMGEFGPSNGMTSGIGEIFGNLQQRPAARLQGGGGGGGLGGMGNQFSQMQQMRGQRDNQFGQQIAGMQGAPLETYKSYLQQVYNAPEMEKATQALGGALDGRVDEFVGMVDEAERAHFGAEESFGFGGSDFQKGLMSQFENPAQQTEQLSQMPQQTGQLGNFGASLMGQMAMFEDGGMVAARPPVSGPTPDVYMQEGGTPAFAPASDEALTKTRQKVIKDYGFDPLQIAMEEGVDPELYLRVMHQESKGDASAVSSAGARNLMQIMPTTAADLGIKDLDDPLANARGGARYLRQQLEEFGTVPLALAAYNAGPGNVRKYKGVPPFDETRKYVSIIHGVSAGEILPNTGDFFQMSPDEDPVRKPPNRPEGLGTPDFEPTERAISEYLMANEPQEAPMPAAPTMRPQGRPMAPDEPAQEGIGDAFYKQYAAYDYEAGPR
jgi:hypothetical protein